MVAAEVNPQTWQDVAIYGLNVVQIVVLAWLARGVAKNTGGIEHLRTRSDRVRRTDPQNDNEPAP